MRSFSPETSIRPDFCGCGLYVQPFYSVVTRISALTFGSCLLACPGYFSSFSERQGLCHGFRSAVAGHAISLTVRPIPYPSRLTSQRKVTYVCECACNFVRDPSQHASLKAEIEAQSSSLYATARLWDDGIIKPTDTRDVVGLGLALAARYRGTSRSPQSSGLSGVPWDGEGRGFGVYRM